MSDFLYTSNPELIDQLAEPLKQLMPEPELITVKEYVGDWGALAVSQSPYNGFAPYETDDYICVVIGGPVLYWRDNHFLTDPSQPCAASEAILERYLSGQADWSEDLSGPFVILIINKHTQQLQCITDLMLFIPAYQYQQDDVLVLGTHVDTVAEVAQQESNIDQVSVDDYIIHGIITYPHTIFTHIFQLAPATQYHWALEKNTIAQTIETYWQPLENNPYNTIDEAAAAFRSGLIEHIERITETMDEVGLFISAGEDSRSIAGMLPLRLKRQSYFYVDSKNREFKLAQRIANIYDCEFNYILRDETHYLDILPDASKLVGSGLQYTHAHSLGLAKQSGADQHFAVFGGYGADALLKATHTRKLKHWEKFFFLPEIEIKGEARTNPMVSDFFDKNNLLEIDKRRKKHIENLHKIRPNSSHEWFVLWPFTMRKSTSNISVNRRLFPSYEVYTSKTAVQHAACIPVKWKKNRKFFHKTVKEYFNKSKFVLHPTGFFPYFGVYINFFSRPIVKSYQLLDKKINGAKNEGPWSDWSKNIKQILPIIAADENNLQLLRTDQKINYLQHKNYLQKINNKKLDLQCSSH